MDKKPMLAVDALIVDDKGRFVAVKRKFDPWKGMWAIPGGFVEYGETVEETAVREAKEETGLNVELEGLLGVYSDPGRDPRGHIVTIVFIATKKGGKLSDSNETEEVSWKKLDEIENMEFAADHLNILMDYRIISKEK